MAEAFYASGSGDRLIDAALLPSTVHAFLDEEQRLLTRVATALDVLVEVGCMHGLHLDWAVSHDKAYVGLDIVDRYVADGRRIVAEGGLPEDRYRFLRTGAEQLAAVPLPRGRAVALFPFNSFGNVADPLAALDALATSGIPFLISTYGTDANATKRRWEYYDACRYADLAVHEDRQGVRFMAAGGLDTMAYHPEYLLARMATRGLVVSRLSFAEFGTLYATCSLVSALNP